jgi:hydroxymethylpyrimidine pyrophosphatase-like HAD family hydrolase
LNFWCGEVSKYKAVSHFLNNKGIDEKECIFFGDSLNDQAMFKEFPTTIGVSNIAKVIEQLKYKPTEILLGESNAGPFGVFNYLKNNY